MSNKGDRRGFLLRLTNEQYAKLEKIAATRSIIENRHVSKQRVLEDWLDSSTIPTPLPQSSETAKEEAS